MILSYRLFYVGARTARISLTFLYGRSRYGAEIFLFPRREDVVYEHRERADEPARWIRERDDHDGVRQTRKRKQIYLTERDERAEHYEHRGLRVSGSAKDSGEYLIDYAEHIEWRYPAQEHRAVCDVEVGALAAEEHDELRREYHYRYHEHDGDKRSR